MQKKFQNWLLPASIALFCCAPMFAQKMDRSTHGLVRLHLAEAARLADVPDQGFRRPQGRALSPLLPSACRAQSLIRPQAVRCL